MEERGYTGPFFADLWYTYPVVAETYDGILNDIIGQHVKKGDQLGFFQYGGSTHCLIFEKGVIKDFVPHPPFDFNDPPIHLGARIATAN